jgi:xylan 1,4-beta-xylosidase
VRGKRLLGQKVVERAIPLWGPGPSPFAGNINFNAQHSPAGAFMSFTCGHFGSGGGIGIEIGKPAAQNLFIGIKQGDRKSQHPIRCLPFLKSTVGSAAAAFEVGQAETPKTGRSFDSYPADQIKRHFGWATDRWVTPDFSFSIYSPFGSIPETKTDTDALRASLLPAVIATLEVDNRQGTETKTAVFAIDFFEPGARLLQCGDEKTIGRSVPGFAWRRSMGVLGSVEGMENGDADGLFALQRWSVAEGLSDANAVHALGTCGGLAIEVPAGTSRTLVLAIGVYLDGVVTTGLDGRYYYTRFYSSLEDVLSKALQRSAELRRRSVALDAKLLASKLSAEQQFLIAHSTRGYYGSTQLLDVGGEPFWIVNEGEYCMMNTLDLSVDHAFWELDHNPWVVKNILTNFSRHYSYHDKTKARVDRLQAGGISFCHDMGVNNNFSPPGHSSYELAHLNGCFSYMTQEQLCNWVLMAACYVAKTADTDWLSENAHLLDACADSMRARANPRTGVMERDSARCVEGQEITTYDSLDESLGQARANTYLAAKCWATWIALEMLSRLRNIGASNGELENSLADKLALFLTSCAGPDGTIPAVLEKDNPGYVSRILPVIESLVYPAYWLKCLASWPGGASEIEVAMQNHLQGPFIDALRRHAIVLLTDRKNSNLFADGGIKLSSTSDNSWMSKIALVQYVGRAILGLETADERIAGIFAAADAAHVRWQTDGSGYWACCDQYVAGHAKGSRYYPRIITTALWLSEPGKSRGSREAASVSTKAIPARG